jgi:hypothetical protein
MVSTFVESLGSPPGPWGRRRVEPARVADPGVAAGARGDQVCRVVAYDRPGAGVVGVGGYDRAAG